MESSKIEAKYRSGCTNCSVVGCNTNYSNTHKSVKLYSFPGRPHERERRRQWINAVRRNSGENHHLNIWEPKPFSRICSKHFIGNAKSNHPHNPAFVPTIFPEVYKKKENATNTRRKVNRFDRHIKRSVAKKSSILIDQPVNDPLSLSENEKACQDLQIRSFSSQVNFNGYVENSSENYFLFECEYYTNNEVATSCNIATNNRLRCPQLV